MAFLLSRSAPQRLKWLLPISRGLHRSGAPRQSIPIAGSGGNKKASGSKEVMALREALAATKVLFFQPNLSEPPLNP